MTSVATYLFGFFPKTPYGSAGELKSITTINMTIAVESNKPMTIAEETTKHMGESKGAANHDHDLIHELSKRLDAVWRYDQYISNAGDDKNLTQLWNDFKSEEQKNVKRLKAAIQKHIEEGCF